MKGVGTPTRSATSTTLPTIASSSIGRPASTSCNMDDRIGPSLRVCAMRTAGSMAMSMPRAAATAMASRIMAANRADM